MNDGSAARATFWDQAVRRLSRRIHLGWWLDAWLAVVIPLALVGVGVILALRWWRGLSMEQGLIGVACGLLAAAGYGVWRMRRQAEPLAVTRVRLEEALGLKARLTAASAGVGPWPEPRGEMELPVRFRSSRSLWMALFCGVLVGAALWVPISRKAAVETRQIEKPVALREVEQWVEELRKEDVVEEESLESVEEKMEALLERPATDWYEHASLEAADHLKELTAGALQQLAQNLEDAERAAAALGAAGAGLPSAAKEALEKQLRQAAQQLQAGGMKPGQGLVDQLRQLDSASVQGLNPQQLKDLAQRLEQNSQALQEALDNAPTLRWAEGKGKGKKKGQGKGEIARGPGTAPLSLEEDVTDLGTEKLEALTGGLDTERLAMGDAVKVTDGAAEVDPSDYKGPQQGGAVKSAGDGGAAVWQNELVPSEREAVKRFFR